MFLTQSAVAGIKKATHPGVLPLPHLRRHHRLHRGLHPHRDRRSLHLRGLPLPPLPLCLLPLSPLPPLRLRPLLHGPRKRTASLPAECLRTTTSVHPDPRPVWTEPVLCHRTLVFPRLW